MHAHSRSPSATPSQSSARPSSMRWVFWGFVAIAAFFLLTEHRAHLIGGLSWLPFLFILACPLMHVFMHRGHGGHGHGGQETEPSRSLETPTAGRED